MTSLIRGINIKHIKPIEPITKKPKKRKAAEECQIICSDHKDTVEYLRKLGSPIEKAEAVIEIACKQ